MAFFYDKFCIRQTSINWNKVVDKISNGMGFRIKDSDLRYPYIFRMTD